MLYDKSKFYTRSDFAKAIGISIRKLNDYINDRLVTVDEATGLIPKSAIVDVFNIEIRKSSRFNTLVVSLNRTEEEQVALIESFKNSGNYDIPGITDDEGDIQDKKQNKAALTGRKPLIFDKYSDLLMYLTEGDGVTSAVAGMRESNYRKKVLQKFTLDYRDEMAKCEERLYKNYGSLKGDGAALLNLPYLVVKDIVTYGRVVSESVKNKDKVNDLLFGVDADGNPTPIAEAFSAEQEILNRTFISLMDKYSLRFADTNEFCFTREDLTPEFLAVYPNVKSGELYDSLVPNSSASKESLRPIMHNQEFDNEAHEQQVSRLYKVNIQNKLGERGFVTFVNVTEDTANEFSNLLSNNCFGNFVFAMTQDEYEEGFSERAKGRIDEKRMSGCGIVIKKQS